MTKKTDKKDDFEALAQNLEKVSKCGRCDCRFNHDRTIDIPALEGIEIMLKIIGTGIFALVASIFVLVIVIALK